MATVMKYILPLFSLFALYAIFLVAHTNGLRGLARASIAAKILPDPTESLPLRTVYTGIEPVDRILVTLTTFFWTVFDGSNPSLLLYCICFAGAFGSAWVLVTLESWRRGNAWRVAALYVHLIHCTSFSFSVSDVLTGYSPFIFGIIAQLATFAVAAPLYCAFQLAVPSTSSRPNVHSIAVPRVVLLALPFVFVVGYAVPSGLMLLRSPDVVSVDRKQLIIAFWQPWPVYIAVLASLAYFLLSPFIGDGDGSSSSSRQSGARQWVSPLRRVYAFAFATAAIAHVVAWTVSLASAIVPVLFNERFVDALHPARVFGVSFPPLPSAAAARQVASVSEGVHVFLQWDFLIGATAVLLWAATLYVLAHRRILGSVSWVALGMKVGLLTLVAGPVATAVELVWERDELVIERDTRAVTGDKKSN